MTLLARVPLESHVFNRLALRPFSGAAFEHQGVHPIAVAFIAVAEAKRCTHSLVISRAVFAGPSSSPPPPLLRHPLCRGARHGRPPWPPSVTALPF